MKRYYNKRISLRNRGSASFELMTVIGIASLVSTALIPLLGASVDVDRYRSTMMQTKQEDYLFDMEAAGLGIDDSLLPTKTTP